MFNLTKVALKVQLFKALLDSSEHFHNASHNFSEHGIKISGLEADLAQMIKRKSAVVSATVSGVEYLMKKIRHYHDGR